MSPAALSTAAGFLAEADAVLVVAGAGMSVGPSIDDYGRTFVDNAAFRHFYPELNFARTSWEASFSRGQPSGWWIGHTHMMTGGAAPSPAYQLLLEIIGQKEHFVLTSNVDGMFSRSGYDPDCIYTPQGDFRVRQCSTPCSSTAAWLGRPSVEQMLPHIDRRTMVLHGKAPESWTLCQRCGKAPQRPNLRGGDFFVHAHYQAQQDKLRTFVDTIVESGKKLVVLEIGCGFNTPVVTRMPAESIAREAGAPFIRVNLKDCDVPETPAFVCLPMDTCDALQGLLEALHSEGTHASAWPQRSMRAGRWRQMLRNLQDPSRPDQRAIVPTWPGKELTARDIAIDGAIQEMLSDVSMATRSDSAGIRADGQGHRVGWHRAVRSEH